MFVFCFVLFVSSLLLITVTITKVFVLPETVLPPLSILQNFPGQIEPAPRYAVPSLLFVMTARCVS